MKFSAPVKPLLAALAPAAKIAPSKSTIPILANVLIEADGEGIVFVANDLDMAVRSRCAARVAAPGRATVAAHILLDILRKLDGAGEAALELTDKGLSLRSGRARFALATLPAEDFPAFDAQPLPQGFSASAKTIAAMLADVAHAISTEETRYYLGGVFVHHAEESDALRFVATDGHRLAQIDKEAPDGVAGMPGVIAPRRACAEIARLCAGADGEARLSLSPAQLRVELGDVVLTTKLIDGTFPDYRRVVPANPHRLTLARAALAAAVDRVATISSERGRAVKLGVGDGLLTISVANPDAGSAAEEIECDWPHAPIEIGFNAAYLLEALATLSGESVAFELDTPGSPAVLRDPARAGHLIVLMPLRV